MKQVLVRKGVVFVDDVPAPTVGQGNVLVKVAYSCISVGTEISGVKSSGESIVKKAINNPDKLKKGINLIRQKGITQAWDIIKGKFDAANVTGYSAAGIVVEIGNNIKDIKIGDRVACAGSGYANHAQYIEVPRNLVVKIPDNVDFQKASTATIGSIAIQGVRRADVRFGENVAIIGMGIIGQITSQIVTAAGARAIAIDLDEERLFKAQENGAKYVINPSKVNIVDEVIRITDGYGADSVIIAATTTSKEPLAQAFQMSRKKGRVVLLGVVGMEIDREDMYKKELDFLISTSYGPGRYDTNYEEKGLDYPYHYVRWTENRNLGEYLNMVDEGKIRLDNIIDKVYDIERADEAYEELQNADNKPLMVLLRYNECLDKKINRKIEINSNFKLSDNKINVALVGVGEFAKGVHLPNLRKLNDIFNIYAIMSRTGNNAKIVAEQYGAKYATTDYREILKDSNVDAIIISTRHNLHASLSIEAMKNGKAVFMEKPMALNEVELKQVLKTIDETKMPYMIGYNRRFSKYAVEAKKHIVNRINPLIISYRMNAGYISLDHWVHSEEGGGRIIGEACHIFDLFNYFTDSAIESISVNSIRPKTEAISHRDNVVISIRYKDGSICTLTYTALGNNNYPKEFCEIYFDGKVITIDDYRNIKGYGLKLSKLESVQPEKGHYEELIEFGKSIKYGESYPIPIWQLEQTSLVSFIAEREVMR
jgi:predicted dehydrogenase/threonine dehydrogenase-like Zn-dependent dehydrogenase